MRLLRQPRLALLFAGSALNAIGSWATLIALWGFAAYRFHAAPSQVAVLGLAWSLPGAVLSPLAGTPIDRFGPRVVMIASDILGVATALAMAAAGSYTGLVILAVLAGAVEAFGRPAASSLPARLVDDADLLTANSLLGVAEQSAIVFGPLAGSLAIAGAGSRRRFCSTPRRSSSGLWPCCPFGCGQRGPDPIGPRFDRSCWAVGGWPAPWSTCGARCSWLRRCFVRGAPSSCWSLSTSAMSCTGRQQRWACCRQCSEWG